MNRTANRRLAALIARPVLAAGIVLGGMTLGLAPQAFAEPAPAPQCSSMAMPNTQAGASNPNPLTRAGQVGAAGAPASTSGSMDMNCQAVGHG
jgi:uncharacterized cupredoxin-like copper-binding protein